MAVSSLASLLIWEVHEPETKGIGVHMVVSDVRTANCSCERVNKALRLGRHDKEGGSLVQFLCFLRAFLFDRIVIRYRLFVR